MFNILYFIILVYLFIFFHMVILFFLSIFTHLIYHFSFEQVITGITHVLFTDKNMPSYLKVKYYDK